jgi:hypothetical protein
MVASFWRHREGVYQDILEIVPQYLKSCKNLLGKSDFLRGFLHNLMYDLMYDKSYLKLYQFFLVTEPALLGVVAIKGAMSIFFLRKTSSCHVRRVTY